MKMNLFWGVLLIIWGFSLILKAIFHINIPVMRVALALLIIWWGVRILIGGHSFSGRNTIIFEKSNFEKDKGDADYNVVFGSGIVDLRGVDISDSSKTVKVDVVFGNVKILTDPNIPTMINLSVVFGEGITPEGSISFIGDRKYANSVYQKKEPALIIKADVVFGSLRIRD